MSSQSVMNEILGPASTKKVSLSPPWIITPNGTHTTKFETDAVPEYQRPQTTLKALRLSVAQAAVYNQKLAFTLGERTLESVVREDPNWLHHGGVLPKFSKGHLGRYYKELEGMGVIGLTRARPHSKNAPIFIITEESPLRKWIKADFEKQVREAWTFATPFAEDVLLPDLVVSLGLKPKIGEEQGTNKMQKNVHSKLQEIEVEKEVGSRTRSEVIKGSSSFLRLGLVPKWRYQDVSL